MSPMFASGYSNKRSREGGLRVSATLREIPGDADLNIDGSIRG